jgi:hypothetical protein
MILARNPARYMYLCEIFAGSVLDRGISGMEEWTSRSCLTGALPEEFAGHMFRVWTVAMTLAFDHDRIHNVISQRYKTEARMTSGLGMTGGGLLLWFGGLRAATSKPDGLRECPPPFWRCCGPDGTGRGARLFISEDGRVWEREG